MSTVMLHDFGELAVVRCAGRIVRGEEALALEEAVLRLGDKLLIVLDLSQAVAIDAGGVGALVSSHQWARRNGIELKLMNPSKPVRQVLELAQLDSLFPICTCEEMAALLGFGNIADEAMDEQLLPG